MIRMAINVLAVCVLYCCAPVLHAAESTTDQAPVASPSDINSTDTRMKTLAERLAHSADSVSVPRTPLSGPDETAAERSATPGQTPLVTSTPLLRPGAKGTPQPLERPDSSWWILKTITALGIVIGLALLVRYVYARMGGNVAGYASPVVEVLSRTTVAPRSHVLLLRVGGRVLVVSDSSAGMRTLASLEDPQEVADILGAVSAAKPTSISKGFSQLLHRFSDDHEPDQPDDDSTGSGVGGGVSGLIARVRSMGREGGPS